MCSPVLVSLSETYNAPVLAPSRRAIMPGGSAFPPHARFGPGICPDGCQGPGGGLPVSAGVRRRPWRRALGKVAWTQSRVVQPGRTADFESVNEGSNPSPGALKRVRCLTISASVRRSRSLQSSPRSCSRGHCCGGRRCGDIRDSSRPRSSAPSSGCGASVLGPRIVRASRRWP
jgi:hypothetical protein